MTDVSLPHTMWGSEDMEQSLNNTIKNAIINDVFLNEPVNNTMTEEESRNNKKRKLKQINQLDINNEEASQNTKLIVVIKGTTENIVDKNELKLKRFFLSLDSDISPNNIKLHKNYITIGLDNSTQVEQLKGLQNILGIAVEVTEHKSNKNHNTTKVIIFGVPLVWTEEEIQTETDALEVHRLLKFNIETKTKDPTTTVILNFKTSDVEKQVYIGLRYYNTKQYIPKPLRCLNCQLYGHNTQNCRGKTICAKCSLNHKTESCTIPSFQSDSQSDATLFKCRNCNENHASGYKGCSAYIKAQTITEIKTRNKISYAEALNRYKDGNNVEALSLPTTPMRVNSYQLRLNSAKTHAALPATDASNLSNIRLPDARPSCSSASSSSSKNSLPTTSTPDKRKQIPNATITLHRNTQAKNTHLTQQNLSVAHITQPLIEILNLIIKMLQQVILNELNLDSVIMTLRNLTQQDG